MAVVRRHATLGWEIAGHFDWPWPIAEMIHQHHERFDGSGYPQGLAGTDILLEARIMAVADTFQAVASRRPYRPPYGTDRAREVVESGSGTASTPGRRRLPGRPGRRLRVHPHRRRLTAPPRSVRPK